MGCDPLPTGGGAAAIFVVTPLIVRTYVDSPLANTVPKLFWDNIGLAVDFTPLYSIIEA